MKTRTVDKFTHLDLDVKVQEHITPVCCHYSYLAHNDKDKVCWRDSLDFLYDRSNRRHRLLVEEEITYQYKWFLKNAIGSIENERA